MAVVVGGVGISGITIIAIITVTSVVRLGIYPGMSHFLFAWTDSSFVVSNLDLSGDRRRIKLPSPDRWVMNNLYLALDRQ